MTKYFTTLGALWGLMVAFLATWVIFTSSWEPLPIPDDPVGPIKIWRNCKVKEVFSGNVLDIKLILRTKRVILAGTEAPDIDEDFYQDAKEYLKTQTEGRRFRFTRVKVHDGKTWVILKFEDGRELNRELLSAGYAKWDDSSSYSDELKELEEEARLAEKGMWGNQFVVKETVSRLFGFLSIFSLVIVGSPYWYGLLIIASILIMLASRGNELTMATSVLVFVLVALLLFGDTFYYIRALFRIFILLKCFGIYLAAGLIWDIFHSWRVALDINRKLTFDGLVVHLCYWPWAMLMWILEFGCLYVISWIKWMIGEKQGESHASA